MEVDREKLARAAWGNAHWDLHVDEPIISIRNGRLVVLVAADADEKYTGLRYRLNAIYDVDTGNLAITRCELRPGFVIIGGAQAELIEERVMKRVRDSKAHAAVLSHTARQALNDRKLPA